MNDGLMPRTPEAFLAWLTVRDVHCWAEGGELRMRGDVAALPGSVLGFIERERPSLLAYLDTAGINLPAHSLSENQRALWLHSVIFPNSSAYRIGGICRVGHAVDLERMRACFAKLLARNSVLRSTFERRFGHPVAVPRPWRELERENAFEVHDARGWSVESLDAAWADALHCGPDLSTGPNFRCVCLRVSGESVERFSRQARHGTAVEPVSEAEDCLLLFVAHHMVMDFMSFSTVLDTMQRLYHGEDAGTVGHPEQDEHAFWSHVADERQWLQGAEAQEHLQYWREMLPAPAPRIQTSAWKQPVTSQRDEPELRRPLPPELSARVGAFARSGDTSAFVVMLSALQIVLSRLGVCRDVRVGTPTHGRSSARFRKTIGYFANMMITRQCVEPTDTFRGLVARNRSAVRAAMARARAPLPWVLANADRARHVTLDTATQVAFVWDSERRAERSRNDFLPLRVEQGGSLSDITLTVYVRGDHWVLGVRHRPAAAAHEFVLALGEALQRCAELATERADERISALQLFDPPAWHRSPAVPRPPEDLILSSLQKWFVERPEAAALGSAGEMLSFADLEARSRAFAAVLQCHVGPGDRAALLLGRSLDSAVLLIAFVRMGVTFVPLNPDQPPDRLLRILRDASPRVLICECDPAFARELDGCVVIRLGELRAAAQDPAMRQAAAPVHVPDTAAVAYLMYTSGSTGVPKGVAVRYGNLNSLIASVQERFAGDAQRWSLFHHFSFDFSMWELWCPLVHGHAVTVLSTEEVRSPVEFRAALLRDGITHVSLTPSACELLLPVFRSGGIDSLRVLFVGGMAMSEYLLGELRTLRLELWNYYGPTEATVWSTSRRVQGDGAVYIGYPLPGTRAYVLDKQLHWVAEGLMGELYLAGPHLAEYFRDPAMTAAAYLPDPWEPGARMYRTGDRACYSARDGLQFIGRNDRQIKFRGYRLELGEIEAATMRIPGITQVVCQPASDSSLAIFYVSASGRPLEPQLLDERSRQLLPRYLLPVRFSWLERMPLTRNNKPDLAALLAVAQAGPAADDAPTARGELRRQLQQLWEQLLGLKDVPTDASFFDLGGTSLMLMSLHEGLTARGHRLSLVDTYTYPTIDALAGFLMAGGVVAEPDAAGTAAEPARDRRARRRARLISLPDATDGS